MLKLMDLKEINGWTDKSLTKLLQLLKQMLPKENTQPNQKLRGKKKYFVRWI